MSRHVIYIFINLWKSTHNLYLFTNIDLFEDNISVTIWIKIFNITYICKFLFIVNEVLKLRTLKSNLNKKNFFFHVKIDYIEIQINCYLTLKYKI